MRKPWPTDIVRHAQVYLVHNWSVWGVTYVSLTQAFVKPLYCIFYHYPAKDLCPAERTFPSIIFIPQRDHQFSMNSMPIHFRALYCFLDSCPTNLPIPHLPIMFLINWQLSAPHMHRPFLLLLNWVMIPLTPSGYPANFHVKEVGQNFTFSEKFSWLLGRIKVPFLFASTVFVLVSIIKLSISWWVMLVFHSYVT